MPKRLIRRRFNIKNPKERDLKKSEKGLSTVVATLLIILVTIVAVGIIWVVIRNVIQNGAEQISLGKITLDLKISQIRVISYTDVNITVKRNSGRGEFSGIVFVAYDESNSEMIRKNVSLNELESRNFQVTLSVVNTSKIKKISIAPVFTLASGKQVVGDIKDEYIFNSKNSIIQVCVSDCPSGAQCGIDSCGKDCGAGCTNPNFPICSNYQCAAQTCIPNCPTGAQCGYDGCTGTCGTCSSLPNSISQCNAGYQCEIQSCIFGYDNCDLNTANGCEVNLQTNNTNCGSCGHTCLAGETCTAGVCIGCVPNTFIPVLNTFCGSQSVTTNCGVQTLSGTLTCTLPNTCGGLGIPNACGCTPTTFTPPLNTFCGNKLINTNCASNTLYTGTLTCTSPQTCGGSGTLNACGCTATTFTPALNTFCGSQSVLTNCGNQNLAGVLNCINPHGSTSCSSGLCQPSCNSGYGNCDSNNVNGCEQSLSDIFNCGACNNFCSLSGATATCTTGSCSISSCNSGYGNCDSNIPNGCETNTNTNVSNCGLCGTACTNIHGSTSCSSGLCQPSCNSGYGNCDSNNVNGCEQSLSSLLDCGSCNSLCLPSNAVASCSTGSCLISSCNSGYGNCDSNNVNGCETNINTNVSNCGLCGTACTNIHGSTSCSSGLCQPICSSNYGSCDSNNINGCETSLTSPIDCGSCGVPCMLSNAAATCSTGSCSISSCNSGYENCDSNIPNGCETNINTNFSNCGSCNHACSTGQTCSGGTCVSSGCTDTSIRQGFEGTFLPAGWKTGGNSSAFWTKSSAYTINGSSVAMSGSIADSSKTWINYSNTFSEDGYIWFYWNVSSESNYDYLCFCQDKECGKAGCRCVDYSGGGSSANGAGEADAAITSSSDNVWTYGFVNQSYTAGNHFFTWCYAKDFAMNVGQDRGIIDNITFFPKSSCMTCTPTTCLAQGKNCDTMSDGCGGTLNCGASCTSPQTCINNVCTSPSCTDGIQNQGETGLDCGGPCPACSGGNIYYVNYTGGNDGNSGLSTAAAWKTISRVNGKTFSAGDQILFARGETWRETLNVPSSGTAANYITFGNYGSTSLNKPRILGSKQAITWTSTATPNVWQSATSLSNPIFSEGGNVFFVKNNVIYTGTPGTSIGALAAEYNWYWASNVLYIYTPAGVNPNSGYSSVEVTQNFDVIFLNNKNYVEINGIDLFYCQDAGVRDEYPQVGRTGFILRNSEIAYIGSADGLGFGAHVLYSNSLFENNVMHDMGRRGIALYNYGTVDIGNIIVRNNTFYNGYHVTGVDVAAGSALTASGDIFNVTIKNNLFYEDQNRVSSSTAMVALYGNVNGGAGVTYDVNISNNIFKYIDDSAIQIYQDVNNTKIYNNVFYSFVLGTTNYKHIYIKDVYPGRKTYIKNNIFYLDRTYVGYGGHGIFMYNQDSAQNSNPADVDANYNLYYSVDPNLDLIQVWFSPPHNEYHTSEWASMKSALGWEKNSSPPADPKFVNPAVNNFNLQSNSPAIWNGTNVGLTTDYEGKQYHNPPSRGAYEYSGTVPSGSTFIRTFYVNATTGIDSNNGTDPGHAWKTITKVNSYATSPGFKPGDGILFERGKTWIGTTAIMVSNSGNSTHQITYGAYGVGAKPVFNFMSSLSGWNTGWTQNGNIWSKTVSNDKRYRLWLSGIEAKRHVDASVNSTEPWYLAEQGTTLYVYSTTNPATAFSNIQSIEAENVFRASSTNADNITIQNLDIQGAYYAINFGGTLGWIIENNSIGWNSNVAIHSWPGYLGAARSFTGNVIIRNNILDSGDRFVDSYMWNNEYECISQRDGANNWDVYNNTFSDWTHGALALLQATTGYPMTNIKFHDNFVTQKDIDYGYAVVYNDKGSLGLGSCYGNEIYNNYIYSSGTVAIQINGDGIKIYNNIIDTVRANAYQDITTFVGLGLSSYSGGRSSDNLIYNNIFMNCAYSGISIFNFGSAMTEIKRNVIANNIFYNNGLYDFSYGTDGGVKIGSNTIKNNLFYKSGSTNRIVVDTQAMTVPTFNAQNGVYGDVITNNIYGDPLFVDANNANYILRNYHLNSGSPAIWNGTNMGLLKDYEGSNYNNPTPSRGAFEYP